MSKTDHPGLFGKGRVGNPGGLSKSWRAKHRALAAYVLEQTEDGKELIDTVIAIMRDTTVDPKVRLAAAGELINRGIGKARETVDLHVEGAAVSGIDWSKVPIDERRRLLDAAAAIGALAEDDKPTEH